MMQSRLKRSTALDFSVVEQETMMTERPANDEMVQGYREGFDLDAPSPSANRSHSYRHGFKNGRADKMGKSRGLTCKELSDAADLAMYLDDQDALAHS
jgi:hypothetical protein